MPIAPIPSLAKTCCLLLISFALLSATHAQSPSKKEKQQAQQAQIETLIDSQRYTFNAQIAMPMNGHPIQLGGESYDLEVGKTTILSYLPYFGRVYSAPLDPARAGIQFNSKNFDYTVTPGSAGGWNILIKTKDLQDPWQLSLDITADGYANLQVNGGNRQSISFSGTIVPTKQHH